MSRRLYPFERSIPHDARSRSRNDPLVALSIDELEDGLETLRQLDTNRGDFWAENGPAFRETVLLAIRETSEALQLKDMSSTLRAELEGQLAWLHVYLGPEPQTLN